MAAQQESQQDKILIKVRALLAKAASTEFEGERMVFMAKADELMEQYAISEVMLAHADEGVAKLIKRKEMDVSWWYQLRDIDRDARSEIWYLWTNCVQHCRCYGGQFSTYDSQTKTAATYGLESDLAYLNMLFTDLFSQMVQKLKPAYDPDKTMGYNIAVAKSAGMKYADIAVWMGKPEWVVNGRPVDHGIMARAYKAHVEEHGQEWITVRPGTYQWSFTEGFCRAVNSRLYQMREQRQGTNTGGMEVAIRDVREKAREALWEDFPGLRPHPSDCTCAQCERARSQKVKPVKYRERVYSEIGNRAGNAAGQQARIVSNDPALREKRKLT